ncbi:hypothetical protein [Paracoccus sp. (in: a-proteobacteria)]|uniref:hypothetical protein n=1 Tax=Paracoccus sp. TaxID=267 RepID=UPI00405A345C
MYQIYMQGAEQKARTDHENKIVIEYIGASLSRSEKMPPLDKLLRQIFPKRKEPELTDAQKIGIMRAQLADLSVGKPKMTWAEFLEKNRR